MLFKTYMLLLLLLTFILDQRVKSQSVCGKGFKCLPYSQCQLDDEFLVLYPCNDRSVSTICCPDNKKTSVPSRLAAFPVKCGDVLSDDRITGGERAAVGQFPWMALLGYTQKDVPITQYLCGGSIITERFVLTAAHCVFLNTALQLASIRLGELDLTTIQDCDTYGDEKVCAADVVDIDVDNVMTHKEYNKDNLKNDIALVKTRRKITFTEYVRPLCLPFGTFFQPRTYHDEEFTVSGWGKINSEKFAGSNDLRFASVTVWNSERCNSSIPPTVKPLGDNQICANGAKMQDACKGDSGGPLFNTTSVNGALRTYQIGIVSFASTRVCGNSELPTIYTRVDRYLDWIVENVIH